MKKDYNKPTLLVKLYQLDTNIALLSTNSHAADWNNIDQDNWDDLFNNL